MPFSYFYLSGIFISVFARDRLRRPFCITSVWSKHRR